MPNKDGTGPEGQGPKTGRKLGDCDRTNRTGRGKGPCGGGQRIGACRNNR